MKVKYCLIFLALLFFTSCSGGIVGYVYNGMGSYAIDTVEKYIPLEAAQKKQLREQVRELHNRHRKEELPQYSEILRSIYSQKLLTQENYRSTIQAIIKRVDVFAEQAIPFASDFIATLKPKQVQELSIRLQKKDDKDKRKDAKKTEAEIKKEELEELYKNFKSLYKFFVGGLSKEQSEKLLALVSAFPFENSKKNKKIRKEYQDKILLFLLSEKGKDKEAIQNKLVELYILLKEQNTDFENETFLENLILTMDSTLSPAQRIHARDTFFSLAKDLDTISKISP